MINMASVASLVSIHHLWVAYGGTNTILPWLWETRNRSISMGYQLIRLSSDIPVPNLYT